MDDASAAADKGVHWRSSLFALAAAPRFTDSPSPFPLSIQILAFSIKNNAAGVAGVAGVVACDLASWYLRQWKLQGFRTKGQSFRSFIYEGVAESRSLRRCSLRDC